MDFIAVKNFERFQHYKDRDPPWIKLYVRILDDYAFARLSDSHKAHLMLIWILASKMENKIPADPAWIANRIGATDPVSLNALMESGFIEEWDEDAARGKREEWASRYVSAQTRSALLSAAQHMCAACRSQKDLEIDHKQPISQGGTGDPDNLQVLCRKCNRKKRARLSKEAAEHLRSTPLRRTTDQRSPETETETETEQTTTAQAPASRPEDNPEPATTAGQVMAAVRKYLWHPDGLPPPDYSDGREMSVIKALMERESGADLIRAVHGLLLLQREGEVEWIGPGKITLRAVYNSKNGSRDMLTQALDAYARGSPEAHAPKKSGQRRADAVRADFILANERIKRGLA